MDEPAPHTITDEAGLREHYRPPAPAIAAKAVPAVDDTSARFIAASPFFVLASSSTAGADASPRGGPPGFLRVLDGGTRVAFADLAGNNRLDSYTNLVERPHVGLLVVVPGRDETVRINGRATVSTDPVVLDATAIDGRAPKVAVVIDVDECFLHCAKALRRGGLWDATTWPGDGEVPTAGEIVTNQHGLPVGADVVDEELEANYAATMWTPGGDAERPSGLVDR